MHTKFCSSLVAGVLLSLAGVGLAQEQAPQPLQVPKALELDYPPPQITTGLRPTTDGDPHCPAFWVLWVDRPIPLRSLVGREVITKHKRPTLALAYREEKREVTEILLQPREVDKLVPCCTVREEKVTDPATGHCSTVSKVVTEDKVVKETIFEPITKKRLVVVQIPYLKPVDVEVPQRSVLFECKTEFRKDGYPVLVPDYLRIEKFFATPCETCAH